MFYEPIAVALPENALNGKVPLVAIKGGGGDLGIWRNDGLSRPATLGPFILRPQDVRSHHRLHRRGLSGRKMTSQKSCQRGDMHARNATAPSILDLLGLAVPSYLLGLNVPRVNLHVHCGRNDDLGAPADSRAVLLAYEGEESHSR